MNHFLIPRGTCLLVLLQILLRNASGAPANDSFANPTSLSENVSQFSGAVFGASMEPGETTLWQSDGSVWWTWTPAVTGFAAITFPAPPIVSFDERELHDEYFQLQVSTNHTLQTFATAVIAKMQIRPDGYASFPITAGQSVTLGLFGDSSTNITYSFRITTSSTPIISSQPQNLALKPGGTGLFIVGAPGVNPTDIHWQFNDVEIPDFYGFALQINNASATNVGSYSAVVSSGGVQSTTQPATLSLTGPDTQPSLEIIPINSRTNFALRVISDPDMSHMLDFSLDLQTWSRLPIFDGPFYAPPAVPSNVQLNLRATNFIYGQMTIRARRFGDAKEQCIQNMRRLQMAQDWKIKKGLYGWSPVVDFEINAYFPDGYSSIACPAGGTTTYNAFDTNPTCSQSLLGHVLP